MNARKSRLSTMIRSKARSILSLAEKFTLPRVNGPTNRIGLCQKKASARFISSCHLSVELKNDNTDFEKRPAKEDLVFGRTFTDHMLTVEWDITNGWNAPKILPYQDLKIDPAATCLHYGE